jgi:hypothetical protein
MDALGLPRFITGVRLCCGVHLELPTGRVGK